MWEVERKRVPQWELYSPLQVGNKTELTKDSSLAIRSPRTPFDDTHLSRATEYTPSFLVDELAKPKASCDHLKYEIVTHLRLPASVRGESKH